MDALNERRIGAGPGSCETDWRRWLALQALPQVPATQLVGEAARIVVVAPHPDDEVLTVGGLLAQLAAPDLPVVLLAVTDGEASHPGSRAWPPQRLAQQRQAETAAALALLQVPATVVRLGLPDGGVSGQTDRLVRRLQSLLLAGDLVFTTWSQDGHPDHEATARATQAAAHARGARLCEVPVWGWHWARVGDARMPWARAQLVPLGEQAVRRRCAALQAFGTQWARDPDCAQTPVLRPSMLQRALRPYELVFA